MEILSAFPEIGQRYEGPRDLEIRVLLYGHYRIPYLVTKERDVRLLGISHGARDIERYLG